MQPLGRTARNAGLLAGLLVIYFVAISYQANRSRTVSVARDAVLTTVSPVQRLVAGGVAGLGDIWETYHGLLAAGRQNRVLTEELATLQQQVRSLQELRRENDRLRAIVGLKPEILRAGHAARVIGRDATQRFMALTIDRGSSDGVTTDAAVIAPDGSVVGRVVEVTPWTSLVQLITDALAGAGGRLESSRATGLVVGDDGPRLQLRYIDSLTDVQPGEEVLTSGDDGIYPPGLLIGHVIDLQLGTSTSEGGTGLEAREGSALFLEVAVRPAANVDRLETVFVLDRSEH